MERHPSKSPSARVLAQVAYDEAHSTLVLFGGFANGVLLRDTWIWDGLNWVEQRPAKSPPAWGGASMTYDGRGGKIVLFTLGPSCPTGGTCPVNETWAWNGSTWDLQNAASPVKPRSGAVMAYDGARREVVLFGGAASGRSGGTLAETWSWDGRSWVQRFPESSPPSAWTMGLASMAYDGRTGTLLLFANGETWVWNGRNWANRTSSS
jgi:hypothetical protein